MRTLQRSEAFGRELPASALAASHSFHFACVQALWGTARDRNRSLAPAACFCVFFERPAKGIFKGGDDLDRLRRAYFRPPWLKRNRIDR